MTTFFAVSGGLVWFRVWTGPCQAARLKKELSAVDRGRREEDAGAAIKLRTAARQAEELKAELASAKLEAGEKARQLIRHRDEVVYFSTAQQLAEVFSSCTKAFHVAVELATCHTHAGSAFVAVMGRSGRLRLVLFGSRGSHDNSRTFHPINSYSSSRSPHACCCFQCVALLQMSAFRQDVKKLREATAQQGHIRQTLRDRDATIRGEETGVAKPKFPAWRV